MEIKIYLYEASITPAPLIFLPSFFYCNGIIKVDDRYSKNDVDGVIFNVRLDMLSQFDRDMLLATVKLGLPVYFTDGNWTSAAFSRYKLCTSCNFKFDEMTSFSFFDEFINHIKKSK